MRFYPNAITLHPEVTETEVLAAATPSQSFAVKDSFARLDLGPAGFRLLAEASWIACEGVPAGPPDDGPALAQVTSPGELGDWESAWADADSGGDDVPVFQPGVLSDPRCTILACRREDTVIAGAVVYAADGAAGVSNLFCTGLAPDRLWAGIQQAVAGLQPHLPVVGYEQGATLKAAQRAGFHVLGTLRVWVRSPFGPRAVQVREQ